MTIGSDFSVASNGDIRHTGGTTIYNVLDLHAWLQDLADNASASGDDLVSILTPNPSKLDGPRSSIKPMALNLLGAYNIDDTAAQFLNFGSISQASGGTLYTGVKSIGSPLVSGSPVYIVQNSSKLTSYWPNGHIQIMVKGKSGGSLIDSGDIRAYSRLYGQTYADFAANLVAGGEQPVAISTSMTDWTPLSKSAALALTGISISVGDVNHDSGDGHGSKLYKGTITLSGGRTVAEAAQYCQAICDASSTTTINGVLGWQYRTLNSAYPPNSAAPFGLMAGGKWFVAQGWWIAGALAADSQKYQMISDDGTTITNPVVAQVSVGNLTVGSYLVVGRDNGSGGYIENEYTLNGAHSSGAGTVVVNESIKVDTPASGYIRVGNTLGGQPYTYSSYNAGTKTFTLTGTLAEGHSSGENAWVPFIDKTVASATEYSANFTYNADLTARTDVRYGVSGSSKQPFSTTFAVTTAGGSTNAIQNADE